MKIYLIRHGESTGDVEDRYGGDYDDSLSPKGVKESEDLAQRLKDENIQIIYASPRKRAMETADIVNKTLDVELKIVEQLRERNNYGVLTGLTKSEAEKEHPEEVNELEKGIHHSVKRSEDYELFKKRILEAFEEISNDAHATIAVITHGGPIRCIIREILKAGELSELADCAIIIINKNGNEFSILDLERTKLSVN